MRFASRAAALAGTLVLLFSVAACGTNDGQGSGGVGGETGVPGSAAPDTGSAAPAGSGGAAGGDVSGELTVWGMGNEGAMLSTLADAFMAEYPEVTVNVTPVAWDQAATKLQAAIGGGEVPDVSQMGTDMMGQFAETGALEPVPSTVDPAQYFESAWNTNVVDGTAYGVPWYVETRLLYYRTDLAEQAGVTAAPTNWQELKDAATKLKGQGGAEWGMALGTKNSQEYLPYVWSNGGDVMADDGTFTLDSPQAVEALTFYDSFFEEGLAPTSVPEGFDITPAFVTGTHPMFVDGPWQLGLIADAGGADFEGKWAIAPLPGKDSAPGTSFVGGSNFVVFKDAPNPDAAWAWIDFVSRPETQVLWYKTAAVLPAVQAAWDDPELSADENLAMFGEQLGSTAAPPAIPTWAEIATTAINENLEKVTVGDLSPEEGAAAMQEAATSIGTGQ
jgi:multiple sugar transport system substrate-binding protein